MRSCERMLIMAACLLLAGCTGAGNTDGLQRQGPSSVRPPDRSSSSHWSGRPSRQASRFTIAATGDILLHEPLWTAAADYGRSSGRAYDFRPMFRSVRAVLRRADLAICHLETPVDRDNAALSSYPVFNVPRQIVPALKHAGYDACSTASNHSLDQGHKGVVETLGLLDREGIAHAGTGRDGREARTPALISFDGITIGHISYSYGLNTPRNDLGVVNIVDPRDILYDATRARRMGADFVVVSMHWGVEYQAEPAESQVQIARTLLRSPAVDLIIGHHAHVVQPLARVHGKYVAYGLGNFLANQSTSCCIPETKDGVIVEFEVRRRPDGYAVSKVRYTPTWMQLGSHIVAVADRLRREESAEELRAALQRSWSRTVGAIKARGLRPPAVAPAEVSTGE